MSEQQTNTETETITIDFDFVSPYGLAKIVSKLVGYEVKPQMIYQYCRQGLIKSSRNSTDKIQVSKESAETFLNKYVPKHRINK